MARLIVADLRRNLGVWAWTSVVALVCATAVAVLLSTIGLAIAQRERDLGLWRALGMRPGTVSAVLLGGAALVGLGAGAAGSALAVPVARLFLPMLVSERVVLAGTAPQWQAGDAGACALAVAALCLAGASAGSPVPPRSSCCAVPRIREGGAGGRAVRRACWSRSVRSPGWSPRGSRPSRMGNRLPTRRWAGDSRCSPWSSP